jgi:crotonobetainyl-CoA:carnitine CoA-transferase CaiB-like acyl-CoA transferase
MSAGDADRAAAGEAASAAAAASAGAGAAAAAATNGAALAHLDVVELADGIAAATCGRQFAAWGGRVTVVEPAGGSPLRRAEPMLVDALGNPRSLLWEHVAVGKCSVVAGDAAALTAAVATAVAAADVLVTDWTPARLAAAGLDADVLLARNPRLVVCRVLPFGASGPYARHAGADLVVQALSGFLSNNGRPDREPLAAPANVLPAACGVAAFVAALAALYERGNSGRGQLVDVAELEVCASMVNFTRSEYTGRPSARHGSAVGGSWRMLRCGDGRYLSVDPLGALPNLLRVLGIDAAALPEPLRDPAARTRDDVVAFLAGPMSAWRARDLFEALGRAGSTVGVTASPADLLLDPHLRARGFFRRIDIPGLGEQWLAGPPTVASRTPVAVPVAAPALPAASPLAGMATHATAAGVTATAAVASPQAAPVASATGATASPRGALAGLRVADFTAAWLGPYCACLLAEMGADVIKIEGPRRPDTWRGWRRGGGDLPPAARAGAHPVNVNGNFNSVNMNKRALTLDLTDARGRDLVRRLVARADLVLENFTPRVMDNLGVGYAALREVRPDLVMVSSSGFGKGGPYRDFRTSGGATEGNCGWDWLRGYRGDAPAQMGFMPADAMCGLQMAAAALVGLLYRSHSGEGQSFDGSMFESGIGYIGEEILLASIRGECTERAGNRARGMAPHGVFPARGSDAWVAVVARDDADFARLVAAVGAGSPLAHPRYATLAGRLAGIDDVEAALAAWTRERTPREAMETLQAHGVPAGAVLDTHGVFADPHFAARAWFVPLAHPDFGVTRHRGVAFRFARTPSAITSASPRLGEHSEAVLRDELGLDAAAIDALMTDGVSCRVVADAGDLVFADDDGAPRRSRSR